jgi:O-antigen/teichoic acid export membrane protein
VTPERAATVRGALIGVGTVVAERAIAFVVVLVLARTLSPESFGVYGYVLAGMTLVQVLADQGIEVAAVARMAATPAAARETLAATLLLRVVLWVALAAPIGGLVLPLVASADRADVAGAGVAASLLVLVGASASVRGALRARGAMDAMARVGVADAALGAIVVVAAVLRGAGIGTIFAARALSSMLVTAAALAVGPCRPALGAERRATLRDVVRVALPLGGNALLIAVQSRAGHLATMALAGPAVVGQLGAAARATEVLGVVPEGALLAVFPRMAADPERAIALAASAARRLAAIVLAPVTVLAVGAAPIAVLLFGEPYAGASAAIAILAWVAVFAVTGGVAVHAVVARGAERVLIPANAVAAVAGLALQVLLIRRHGLTGAAVATVATAAIGQIVLLVPRTTREVVLAVWRAAAPPVVVAAAAVALGRWIGPDLVGAAAAAGGYGLAVVALGLVGREDWRDLRGALDRAR